MYKVDDLVRTWAGSGKHEGFSDFVPMRLATIIEVFVRETVADVVDSGQAYLDRAEPLLQNAKLDFLVAKNLHGRKVTMGDIVAHALTVTNVEHVISTYETLFPGYRRALPGVRERWIESRDQDQPPILQDVERVLGHIRKLFDVRHIVTHEMPRKPPYQPEEIIDEMVVGARRRGVLTLRV